MLLALVGLLLLAPVRAWAHIELAESDPADGAALSKVPSTVTMTFSEDVTGPAQVAVTAPNGTRMQDGDPATADATVTQRIKAPGNDETAGTWTVAYRVLSIDGHAVTGEMVFTVDGKGNPATATESPAAAPSPSDSADPADPSAWYTQTSWLVVAIGVLLAAVLVWALRGRRRA